MPEKVLLIHGIAMRSEEKVARYAATLNRLIGDDYELVPVYWGDLGGDDTYLHKVMGRYDTRADGFSDMMRDVFARPAQSSAGKARAWIERRKGAHDKSTVIRRLTKRRSEGARSRVRGYLGDKFQDARLWLTQQTIPFIADVIVYQSHTYREKIQSRVREVIRRELGEDAGTARQPVKVVAHSLGGVVAFDMACKNTDALHIDGFVTLGSQPALFHLLDPREGVPPFEGEEPVPLPETINRWTNVWDEYDMLAFSTREIFTLFDGSAPLDVRVRATRSRLRGGVFFKSHLKYFENEDSALAIKATMDG